MNDWTDTDSTPTSFFIICYPGGDTSQLSVAEICYSLDYEVNDYALASRQRFDTHDEAFQYARTLAKDNGLSLKSSPGEHAYLD